MLGKLLVIVLFYHAINAAPQTKVDDFQLTILHNNDMHGRFIQTGSSGSDCTESEIAESKCYGGFARTSALIKKYRQESVTANSNVLYLNAGDTFTGTPWFNIFRSTITSELMNILQPDAASLGNHEFDLGVIELAKYIGLVEFPIVAANLDFKNTPELLNNPKITSSQVIDKNGVKIGIIGFLLPETKTLAPANTVEFKDEIQDINTVSTTLKSQGVNIIIALGHSGFEIDKEIAMGCPDVDIVVGGHSNTFLWNGVQPNAEEVIGPYPFVVTTTAGKKVPVVQAFAFTKYLGKITLDFDSLGNLVNFEGNPILLDSSFPEDQVVLTAIEKYQPEIDAIKKEIVGKTKVKLDGATTSCRMMECNLGNLITDAMVYQYALDYVDDGKSWTDAPIAFMQGGGIRGSIDGSNSNGAITKMDLYTIMPFDNLFYTVSITGKVLKEALEWSVHRYTNTTGYGEFLQMSGVQLEYDLSQKIGERLVHADVLCGDCEVPDYSPIVDTKQYKIIVTSFLVEGGDGFHMFNTNNKIALKGDIETFEAYIKSREILYPAVEWRITFTENLETEGGGDGGARTITVSIGLIILSVFLHYIN